MVPESVLIFMAAEVEKWEVILQDNRRRLAIAESEVAKLRTSVSNTQSAIDQVKPWLADNEISEAA